jgi:hypothetical protein
LVGDAPLDGGPLDGGPLDGGPLDGVCGLDPGLFLGSGARGLVLSGSSFFAGISSVETVCLGALLFGG